MKEQINPTIKAHLLRGAFYLLLLLAVCAIPFALAQSRNRGTAKHSLSVAAKKQSAGAQMPETVSALDGSVPAYPQLPNVTHTDQSQQLLNISGADSSQVPTSSNVGAPAPALAVPLKFPQPAAPAVVLYDQINNPAPTPGGVTSQDFEAANDPFDSFAADDFVVPGGQSWEITEVDVAGEYNLGGGPAASFNVFFYQDSATLPGTLVATRLANPYTNGANAMIMLTSSVTLAPGTYWVAVQSRQDFTPAGQWFWDNRSIISNSGAAQQNPGGGFGVGCTTYGRKTTCLPTQNGPDELFRLVGNIVGGTPSPTPTASPTPTSTPSCTPDYTFTVGSGTIVPGTTDTGNHVDDGTTAITLPFPYTLYGQSFTAANISSNGNLQFVSNSALLTNACPLPSATFNMPIMPHWDDLRTDQVGTACTAYGGVGCGVFTSISGTAPNRIFNIEWRTVYFGANTTRANFELRLYEGQNRFDMVYGEVAQTGSSATVGVQQGTGAQFTQYECNTAGTVNSGLQLVFTPAWQNEPPMTNARRNAATAVVGSNLYAITGFNAAPNYTNVNEAFNGTSWAAMAPIPTPHAQARAASVGTKIYVPGGFNSISFGGPLPFMQIYDTVANTWSAGMDLPAARSGVATAAVNGLVYVIGGYNPVGTVHSEVYIYDPVANSYTTGAPMTAGQGNAAGVLLNGEIYVVGGGTAPGAQFAYNPATNMWRTIAPLPTTGGTCQSDNGFVLDNELWIVGCLGLPIDQQVWIYNPGSNMWRPGPQYNVDHQGPGAALFNARGFVVGGGSAGGGSTAVESFGPCPGETPTPTATATPTATVSPRSTPTPRPRPTPGPRP